MSRRYELAVNTVTALQRRVLNATQGNTTVEEIAKAAKLDERTTKNVLLWLEWKGLISRHELFFPSDEATTRDSA